MTPLHQPASDRTIWYHVLFFALLLSLVVQPLADTQHFGESAHFITRVVVLLACVMAMGSGRPSRTVAWVALTSQLLLTLIFKNPSSEPHLIAQGLGALIIVMVCAGILRRIFTARDVTWAAISGAVAVFLLLGYLWTMFYSMAAWSIALEPAFHGVPPASELLATAKDGDVRAEVDSLVSYFSLVTMTTLGYGDITPAHPVTRGLATAQAVIGQLYLVVLVARLVSMHTRSSIADEA